MNFLRSLRALFVLMLIGGIVVFNSCKEKDNGDPPIENKPVAIQAEQVYKSSFLARWDTVEQATGYKLYVSTSQNFNTHVLGFDGRDVGKVSRAFAFNLQGNTKYYYRVKAMFESSESGFSNTIELTTNGNAQLPNSNFEVWQDFDRYMEPAPRGYWATPNKVADLLVFLDPPPVMVERTTDAYSGSYAARISTFMPADSSLPLMTGTVATGIFEVDWNNMVESLKQGMPFTSRPSAFKGYYKYLPVKGDSCNIYAHLTRWNEAAGEREFVAKAQIPVNDVTVESYTGFNLPFNYLTQDNPDTIIMIFVSSAGGDDFMGHAGSALYIDDISLIYE